MDNSAYSSEARCTYDLFSIYLRREKKKKKLPTPKSFWSLAFSILEKNYSNIFITVECEELKPVGLCAIC